MHDIGTLPSRMNPTDALFWLMEPLPQFRSNIGGLLVLDGVPGADAVRAELDRLVGCYCRLRQRVVDAPLGLAPPEWVPDRDFDLDYHLRTIAVPAPAAMEDLLVELSPLFATPLDRARPLWEAYYADGLAGGRSALFVKLHHCLMDGVGGTRILTDLLGDPVGTAALPVAVAAPPSMTMGARLARAAAYRFRDAVTTAGLSAALLMDGLCHPRATVAGLRAGVAGAVGLARELTIARAESPLHAERSLSRRLATVDLSLSAIDAVRARVVATNNDVLLTVVSGALHRWHTSRGADVTALRILVPVNLRSTADDVAGNRIALLAVGLPVGEPNPLRRLRLIQEHMGRVKRDRRAALYPLAARLIATLPPELAARVVAQQMNRANLVCTNVPGPPQTCYFAGCPIEAIYAFAPMVGDHPVAIAAYRYRDRIHVGLDVDPLAMPDLARFLDALRESYAETMELGGADADVALPSAAAAAAG